MESNTSYCQRCGGANDRREIDGRVRPVCGQCGEVTYLDPKLAVAVVVQRDGKVLLGRRGPHTRAPGRWSFPAGFVERGEVVEAAAIREVLEETGLAIELGPLAALLSSPGESVVLAVYTGTVRSGTAHPQDDLTELGWFAPAELPELAFPHDSEILSRLSLRAPDHRQPPPSNS